jgi:hypothetical protein
MEDDVRPSKRGTQTDRVQNIGPDLLNPIKRTVLKRAVDRPDFSATFPQRANQRTANKTRRTCDDRRQEDSNLIVGSLYRRTRFTLHAQTAEA